MNLEIEVKSLYYDILMLFYYSSYKTQIYLNIKINRYEINVIKTFIKRLENSPNWGKIGKEKTE